MSPIALTLLAGCATSTGGERVSFHARVEATAPIEVIDGAPAIRWTDTTGWTLTLTEASLWAGPAYLWSEEPRLDPSGLGAAIRWLGGLRPIAEAEAADQFRAGFLVGEVTTQTRINLLGPALDLPDGDGLAGPSRSAELWLEPSPDGDTLSMRGVAARDGVVIPFRAGMTIDERWVSQPDDNPVLLRRLRGILWDAEIVDGGTLTLGVDPRRWLDGADFSTLAEAPADSDGTRPVTPDGPVGRTIYARSRRIGPTGPWSFTWQPPEAP